MRYKVPNLSHNAGVLGTLYDEATKAFEELKKTANVLGKDVTLDGDLLLDGNLEFKTEAQELVLISDLRTRLIFN